ncbi:MAG: SIMPL domain-containing protein [Sulfuricurvum sp.]|uniref:SIMPL domain-containing protein n=1 Tax=Sulfuricurvum sp. TaxID=2025608 RepID=UPI002604676A|nr:SIMPL domain-containing protein [Sulfuricurvum sp.]MDD5160900.1 SIMPL domain-containing protein [Sulfuricurvum sp.]
MYKFSIACLLPVLVSAQMHITTSERVETLLKPDVLRGSLSFEEQGKNQNTIKEHLNTIVAEVKRFDPNATMCQGGGYYLSPQYSYKDQKREFVGYSANLSFGCEFKSIDTYNALSTEIDKVTAVGVRKSQGELNWGVSRVQEATAQGNLRMELLRKARDQAEAFSKETGLECFVSTVNFSGVSRPIPMMAKGMAMVASVPTESPIQSDETTQVEATVDYNCSKRVP